MLYTLYNVYRVTTFQLIQWGIIVDSINVISLNTSLGANVRAITRQYRQFCYKQTNKKTIITRYVNENY